MKIRTLGISIMALLVGYYVVNEIKDEKMKNMMVNDLDNYELNNIIEVDFIAIK